MFINASNKRKEQVPHFSLTSIWYQTVILIVGRFSRLIYSMESSSEVCVGYLETIKMLPTSLVP